MPNSSGLVLIWRRSIARMVPSQIGSSYCLPVRLSTTVRESFAFTAVLPFPEIFTLSFTMTCLLSLRCLYFQGTRTLAHFRRRFFEHRLLFCIQFVLDHLHQATGAQLGGNSKEYVV